jgi:hypothetical protein
MRYLKTYNNYLESLQIDLSIVSVDLNESLGIYYENILQSIGAEEKDLYDTFSLPKDDFVDKLNLDVLTNNTEFINSLASIGLKKSTVQSSEDFETYLNKPCRFMLIYRVEANELENPSFILFQSYNQTIDNWEEPKLYKINGEIKNFYDKLSSKVIEVDDNGEKYIYNTTNGNEWSLQNIDKENDIYKKYFRKDEFEKLIKDRKVKINII